MSNPTLMQDAAQNYQKAFGTSPEATAYAPGRVNLLGEHTDYNGGFVLPMPLRLGTAVALGRGGQPGTLSVASAAFDDVERRAFLDAPNGSWTDYVLGSLLSLLKGKEIEAGIQVAITSDLPVGSGLSSSAALEVASIRAALALFEREMSDVDIAVLARQAENEFVGVPCGIMDQFSVSVGKPGTAVFLDTRTLQSTVTPLPDTHNFVIIHSGVGHKLSDNGYQQRVKECAAACQALGVELLSDLGMDDLSRIEALRAPLDGRARHIVTENDRVTRAVDAIKAQDIELFSRLMIESHDSQRDDYEVSVPEVDALVSGALEAGALGARLTGGGFGGSIVAFVAKDSVARFCGRLEELFQEARVLAIT